MDSRLTVLDYGQSLSVALGFRIPFVGGIPDSLSHSPDSKAQYSGLIPQSKIFRIVESLHGATIKNTVFLSVCFLTAT